MTSRLGELANPPSYRCRAGRERNPRDFRRAQELDVISEFQIWASVGLFTVPKRWRDSGSRALIARGFFHERAISLDSRVGSRGVRGLSCVRARGGGPEGARGPLGRSRHAGTAYVGAATSSQYDLGVQAPIDASRLGPFTRVARPDQNEPSHGQHNELGHEPVSHRRERASHLGCRRGSQLDRTGLHDNESDGYLPQHVYLRLRIKRSPVPRDWLRLGIPKSIVWPPHRL
jgi:hypothetical protein